MQLIYYSDTLTHHGIKGQKWGIRRYQPYPKGHKSGKEIGEAANYSKKHRSRDKKIYGNGAVKRINRRMLNGESIQSARHNEVERKASIDSGKKVVKAIAKGALVAGGSVAVFTLIKKKGFGDNSAGIISDSVINAGKHTINAILR